MLFLKSEKLMDYAVLICLKENKTYIFPFILNHYWYYTVMR